VIGELMRKTVGSVGFVSVVLISNTRDHLKIISKHLDLVIALFLLPLMAFEVLITMMFLESFIYLVLLKEKNYSYGWRYYEFIENVF
jgi:hypothetical protein